MLLLLFSKFSFPFFISNLYQTDVTLKFAALSMGIDQNDQDEKQLQDYKIKGEGRHEKKPIILLLSFPIFHLTFLLKIGWNEPNSIIRENISKR